MEKGAYSLERVLEIQETTLSQPESLKGRSNNELADFLLVADLMLRKEYYFFDYYETKKLGFPSDKITTEFLKLVKSEILLRGDVGIIEQFKELSQKHEDWLSKVRFLEGESTEGLKNAPRQRIKQKELAIFYRTLQKLNAYPEFGQDGRIIEDHYREIGLRHGVSPGNFKKHYLENSAKKSVGELAQIIPINHLEALANLLPNPEKLRDLLKIENAKTIKK